MYLEFSMSQGLNNAHLEESQKISRQLGWISPPSWGTIGTV
jgi:hypothetical protein